MKKYTAFISYESHCERSVNLASKLYSFLRGYKLPHSLRDVYQQEQIGKIFDYKKYNFQNDYRKALRDALAESEYLIVITSKSKSESLNAHNAVDYRYPNAAIKLFLGFEVDMNLSGDEELSVKFTDEQIKEIEGAGGETKNIYREKLDRIIPFVIDDDLQGDPEAWKNRLPDNLRCFVASGRHDNLIEKQIYRTSQLDTLKSVCVAAHILLGNAAIQNDAATPLYIHEETLRKRKELIKNIFLYIFAGLILYGIDKGIELYDYYKEKILYYYDYLESFGNIYPYNRIDEEEKEQASSFYLVKKREGRVFYLERSEVISAMPWAAVFPRVIECRHDDNKTERHYEKAGSPLCWVKTDEDVYNIIDKNEKECAHELNVGIERYFDFYEGSCCVVSSPPDFAAPRFFRMEYGNDSSRIRRYFMDSEGNTVLNGEHAAGFEYESDMADIPRVTGIYLINAVGERIENENGISGVKYQYVGEGTCAAEVSLVDDEGCLCNNSQGVAVIKNRWNGRHLTSYSYFDETGAPAENSNSGVHKVTFSYDADGSLSEFFFYDKSGNLCMNQLVGYAGLSYCQVGNIRTITYHGADKKPVMLKDGFAIKKEKVENGQITEARFFDVGNNPCLNKGGYAIARYQYDDKGRCTSKSYFDVNGKPCRLDNGYSSIVFKFTDFDDGSCIEEITMYEPDGKPFVCDEGYASEGRQYDEYGRLISLSYYKEDKLCHNERMGCSRVSYHYSDSGERTERYYDENNKTIDFKSEGYHKLSRIVEKDAYVRERYFDRNGRACPHKNGYYFRRYKMDEAGRLKEAYFYDQNNRPAISSDCSGYGVCFEYEGDNTSTCILLGKDGRPMKIDRGYAAIRTSYDPSTRTTETCLYDADMKPCLIQDGWHKKISRADEQGNEQEVHLFGVKNEPVESTDGFHHSVKRNYEENGAMVREVTFERLRDNSSITYYRKVKRSYEAGNDKVCETCYYDRNAAPCKNDDGWYREMTRRDVYGNTVTSYFDSDGKPLLCNGGYHMKKYEVLVDGEYKTETSSYYGINGESCINADGISVEKITTAYNVLQKVEYTDAEGKPVRGKDGYARAEIADGCLTFYDESGASVMSMFGYARRQIEPYGEKKRFIYYNEDGEGISTQLGAGIMVCSYGKVWLQSLDFLAMDNSHVKPGKLSTRYRDYLELGFEADPSCYVPGYFLEEVYTFNSSSYSIHRTGLPYQLIRYKSDKTPYLGGFEGVKSFCLADGSPVMMDVGYSQLARRSEPDELRWESTGQRCYALRYLDAAGKPCADAEGCYGRRCYHNRNDELLMEIYFDKEGEICRNRTDGAAGKEFEYDAFSRCVRTQLLGVDGTPIRGIRGFSSKKIDYQWKERCIEVSFYDFADMPCCIKPDGVHKIKERFDEQFRLIEQICYGVDGAECNNSHGYCRRLIEYTPTGVLMHYVDVNGNRVETPAG